MCGITGIFNLSGEPVAHQEIKAMNATLCHRGPDGEGYYVDGPLAFGHADVPPGQLHRAAADGRGLGPGRRR